LPGVDPALSDSEYGLEIMGIAIEYPLVMLNRSGRVSHTNADPSESQADFSIIRV
jgi:hypothetical protein